MEHFCKKRVEARCQQHRFLQKCFIIPYLFHNPYDRPWPSLGLSGVTRIDSLVWLGSLQHMWRFQKRHLHVLDLRQIGVV